MTSETTNETLRKRAAAAVEAGDRATGRRLLAQVLRANPEDETAWLWMAAAVDEPERRRQCLERVLAINSRNPVARQHLKKLEQGAAATETEAPVPARRPDRGPAGGSPREAGQALGERIPTGVDRGRGAPPPPAQRPAVPATGPPSDGKGRDAPSAALTCEKRHRPLGPALLTCEYRQQGACPYQVERMSIYGQRWMGWVMLAFGLAIPLFTLLAPSVGMCFIPFGLVAAAIGVYLASGVRTILHNPDTGQMWEQTTLFGQRISYVQASALQPIAIDAGSIDAMRVPASVSALHQHHRVGRRSQTAWIEYAADVFYAALLSVCAQEVVQLHRTLVEASGPLTPSGPLFVVTSGRHMARTTVQGALESRIVQAVDEWAQRRDPSIRVLNTSYARKLRHCLTLYDLMIVVVEGDQTNPGRWLVSAVVGVDASERGIGETRGALINRFKISPAEQRALLEEYRVVQEMERRFAAARPEVVERLRQDIRDALKSRIDDD